MKGNAVTSVFEGIRPPTVLQVVPALETGGAERTAVDIARALVEAGAKALVASRGGRMVAELEAAGATHIELAVHSKNPVVMALNVERLTRLAAKHGADIIHARSRAPAWSCLIAARKTGVKLVTTFHGVYNYSTWIKKYYNSIMTDGHRVIAVSNFVKKHILEPLQMKNSGWRGKNYEPTNQSTLYWMGHPLPDSDLITYPDGNFMSSVIDYGTFLSTMIQGYQGEDNVLTSKSYKVMMKNPVSSDFKKGIFWSVDSEKIGHSGNDPGIISHAYILKKLGIGIVVFINTSDTENSMIDARDIYRTLKKYAEKYYQ